MRRSLFPRGGLFRYAQRRLVSQMTWRASGIVITAVIALIAGGVSRLHLQVPSLAAGDSESNIHGRISKVVDGDTLWVTKAGGGRVKVRMIGMDAPESYALRYGHTECGGKAASNAMKALAAKYPNVTLVSDPTQDSSDKYHRALAYVVPRGGGPSLQEHLIEQGWAAVYVYDNHPFQRARRFRDAAAAAKRAHRGVWATCGGDFHRAAS